MLKTEWLHGVDVVYVDGTTEWAPLVGFMEWSDAGPVAPVQKVASPDAKPAIAGLMRVNGKARGFGWCDE